MVPSLNGQPRKALFKVVTEILARAHSSKCRSGRVWASWFSLAGDVFPVSLFQVLGSMASHEDD